jgi:hypothetical protein
MKFMILAKYCILEILIHCFYRFDYCRAVASNLLALGTKSQEKVVDWPRYQYYL